MQKIEGSVVHKFGNTLFWNIFIYVFIFSLYLLLLSLSLFLSTFPLLSSFFMSLLMHIIKNRWTLLGGQIGKVNNFPINQIQPFYSDSLSIFCRGNWQNLPLKIVWNSHRFSIICLIIRYDMLCLYKHFWHMCAASCVSISIRERERNKDR